MSEDPQTVVVGYDFSVSGHAAIERAIGVLARAPWHVLHVVCVAHPRHPFPVLPAKRVDVAYADRIAGAAREVVMRELRARAIDDRIEFFVHARIARKPAAEILQAAEELGADLIIVGCKGLTGIERAMLGSTAERIVREAGCTVEVARPKTYGYVPLLHVSDVEAHHTYVPPHRYVYEEHRVQYRPHDWPLY